MLTEFKKFAMKGNVIDLAVGVIIGGAFGKIVSSLVNDVIMPISWAAYGGIDFKSLAVTVGKAELKYGMFLQTVVDFLIISFSIFLFIRFLNRFKKKEEPAKVVIEVDKKEELLAEIRDLLRAEKELSRKNETS